MSVTIDNNENEHLLERKWVLWFRPPGGHSNSTPAAKSWEESQKLYFSADTVEDFWRGFHKLPRIVPGHPLNCDYSLFRDGIKPMWEDEQNKMGGRWTYSVERRQSNATNMPMPNLIEQVWLDVMLCLIGEGFHPHGEKIAGGVCGIRQPRTGGPKSSNEGMAAKIHIWTLDASDVEANMKIGEILKDVLHAPDGQLTYSPHDTKNRGGYNSGGLRL